MANADFEKQNSAAASGFSAASYQKAQSAPARSLTPLQQKLAGLEKALPSALKTRAAALTIALLVGCAGFFGVGGAKLAARYRTVKNAFVTGTSADTTGTSADTKNGKFGDYTVQAQLSARGNAAANVITSGLHMLGESDSYVTAAQAALDAFNAAMDGGAGPAALYDADAALGQAVDSLYSAMQEKSATPLDLGTAQTEYSAFNSAGTVLSTLRYNDVAQAYNDMASGLPAKLLGALWGCGKAELFA